VAKVSSRSPENSSRSERRATAPLKRWAGLREHLTILWTSHLDPTSLTALSGGGGSTLGYEPETMRGPHLMKVEPGDFVPSS
jgi:hypothetical protein